jgi:hypothetical protein
MSTLKADTIQSTGGGAATLTKQEAAKSRVSATITSNVHTIQDSFNVSDLIDDGAGRTDVQFTNNMNNDDYSATATCGKNGSNMFAHLGANTLILASEYRCNTTTDGGTTQDYDVLCSAVHGDLA